MLQVSSYAVDAALYACGDAAWEAGDGERRQLPGVMEGVSTELVGLKFDMPALISR